MHDFIQCLEVTGGLFLLLVIPFLFLASVIMQGKGWPTIVLVAMALGCSVQAVSGLLWSHIIRGYPFLESLFALFAVVALTLLGLFFYRHFSKETEAQARRKGHRALPLILTAAFLVRSIHPLNTFALGQSDAYTHLHYLNYIVEQGFLANVVYPAGYHWLLALPVIIFKIDPYSMARFSGAFFGAGLVLGIYVFLEKTSGRRAAIFGSFCAACFPGMILLMKTGVGSFANQLGLFLLPCLLYSYSCFIRKRKNPSASVLFSVAALGLAASVPMMLIHVFIIVCLERVLSLFRKGEKWFLHTVSIAAFCLPAIFLIAFHFSYAGAGQRFQTAQILTNYGEQDKAVTAKVLSKVDVVGSKFVASQKIIKEVTNSPYLKLLIDFLSVKRVGYSSSYVDSMACILFVLFLLCIWYGIYRKTDGLVLLGLWGALTSVQAGTGFLQFSSYQREGWSLLVATSCLSGILAALPYEPLRKFLLARVTALFLMLVSLYWTVQHPPAHPAMQSSAEDLLIRTVRYIGEKNDLPAKERNEQDRFFAQISVLLNKSLPVILVSRKFVGWHNQGELVPNVLPPDTDVTTLLVNARQGKSGLGFSKENQYVVLVDKQKNINPAEMISAFAMVSPELVKGVLQQQKYLYRANYHILDYIDGLDSDEWLQSQVVLSEKLTCYVVTPVVEY